MKRFWKKALAVLMAFCMGIVLASPGREAQAATKKYLDVAGHRYEEALLYVIKNGIMSNSGSKIFPDSALTKGAACLSLNILLGAAALYEGMDGVGNLKEGDKYYVTVSRGLNCGYLKQKENGDVYSPLAKATYGYLSDIFSDVLGIDMSGAIVGSHKRSDTLTRGEYAALLTGLAPNIISKNASKVVDGDVYLTKPEIELSNTVVNGNLIVTDAVGDGEVTLRNVTINGSLIVRGGGENSIIITGRTSVPNIIVQQVNNNVNVKIGANANVTQINVNEKSRGIAVQGRAETLNVKAESIKVTLMKSEINSLVLIGKGLELVIPSDAVVNNMDITESASGSRIDVSGRIENVKISASDSEISVNEKGKISEIKAEKDASRFKLNVAKGAVVDKVASEADSTSISGDGSVKDSMLSGSGSEDKSTGTTEPASTAAPIPTSPASSSNGDSPGGSGGGGTSSTPTPKIIYLNDTGENRLILYAGETPQQKTFNHDAYSGTITWEGSLDQSGQFIKNNSYTATVTLTARSSSTTTFKFSPSIKIYVSNDPAINESVIVEMNTGTMLKFKVTITATSIDKEKVPQVGWFFLEGDWAKYGEEGMEGFRSASNISGLKITLISKTTGATMTASIGLGLFFITDYIEDIVVGEKYDIYVTTLSGSNEYEDSEPFYAGEWTGWISRKPDNRDEPLLPVQNVTVSGSVLTFKYPDDTEEWIHGYYITLASADGSELPGLYGDTANIQNYLANVIWHGDSDKFILYIRKRSDDLLTTVMIDLSELFNAMNLNLPEGEYKICGITTLGGIYKPDSKLTECDITWNYISTD